jgi:hypothetical protein
MYRYTEVFEQNAGFHLYRDNWSILVQAIAYGRRLSNEDMANFTKHVNRFIDSDLLTPPCNEWRGYRAEPVDLDVAGC